MAKVLLTTEQKEANKLSRKLAKDEAKRVIELQSQFDLIDKERTQKAIKSLKIIIEWKKNKTWGNNPFASVEISYLDGTFYRGGNYTCSGCGYNKESTVIAQIFNDYLKYTLWNKLNLIKDNKGERSVVPYGIHHYVNSDLNLEYLSFDGGIDTSCYYHIAKFIGGEFQSIASGKTFDVYEFTANNMGNVIVDEMFDGYVVVDENRDIIQQGCDCKLDAVRWAEVNGYMVVTEF